jgi:anhydro-N-acetylmuramic acid kinase
VIVAGVMSGTSADGINVALVEVRGSGFSTRFKLLGHYQYAYPAAVRQAVLAAMNATGARVADLSRLNFLLGELYAAAVLASLRKSRIRRLDLVGCHGQTIYHQGEGAPFLGRKIACTWQTGEGAVIAARVGAPVVSDFRPADMAAGGKGAPLVPFFDYLVYRDQRMGRIVQNIGGIANLTAIPAAASPEQVMAFDTGPGNMVIDTVTERLFHKPYDRDGDIARQGKVLQPNIQHMLQLPFFRQRPPKTAGREQFGREFVNAFLRLFGKARREDVVATATALTVRSIGDAIRRFVLTARGVRPQKSGRDAGATFSELIVSGGGARNKTLLAMLDAEVRLLGFRLRLSDEFGVPSEAKEAVAFALLAYQTWHREPANVPAATGAKKPAVLGKISYP